MSYIPASPEPPASLPADQLTVKVVPSEVSGEEAIDPDGGVLSRFSMTETALLLLALPELSINHRYNGIPPCDAI